MERRKPRWRTLTDDYRQQIESGALEAGAPFPSRSQMKTELNIHANTASRILLELEREGLVKVEIGRRAVVLGPPQPLERTRAAHLKP